MRKLVILLLVLTTGVSLSACGDGEPAPTAEPTAAPASPTSAPAAPEPTPADTPSPVSTAAVATVQPTATSAPAAQPTKPPAATATPEPTIQPTQPPTATATPTPPPTPEPTAEVEEPLPEGTVTPVAFFLLVTSPTDESVVTTATVEVTGQTTPDAVVTVNGYPADVDANGDFTMSITLEEGINFVEVVASDFGDNSAEEVRTLIYDPPVE